MMEFSGRLASFPIAELLQWAHNDRRTGSLVVRRSSREKRIYLSEGRIVACMSDHTSEFYGQHLLLGGHIQQEELLQCLARCRQESMRLGQALEELEILRRSEVEKTLRQHLEDMICDIFLWRHGIFFFRAESPPREEILAESIDTVGIAFEGTRWSDEYRRIRSVFEHDEIVLRRFDRGTAGTAVPTAVSALGLRAERLFHLVDGVKTLEEIYQKIQGSYFRFLHAAFDMHEAGFCEVGDIFEEGGITSVELSLQDVIFEQAATEHLKSTSRRIASPFNGFERFSPIWVRQPDLEEWDRMPKKVKRFYKKLNGKSRLAEILSEDEEQWNREVELLMLQLAKERIALLPAPLAEIEAEAEDASPEEEAWLKALIHDSDASGG